MQQYLTLFLAGFVFRASLYLWLKAAHRWSAWFPVLRGALKWGLVGAVLLSGGATLYLLQPLFGAPIADWAPSLLSLGLGLGVPEAYALTKKNAPAAEDETQRGSEQALAKDVAKQIKASKKPTDLVLGDVPLPVDSEPYHFLVAGSTGTGKSVALSSMIARLRERGDTVILVDSGGDFLARFFRPEKDYVFNPYDDRCVGWSPVLEMQGAWDAQALARSIVPDGVGETKEWNGYAQTFISSVLRKLWEAKRLSMADFLYYVQVAPLAELKDLLAGTPSASQLASEKMFGSIRSIASNYLVSYDYLPRDKAPFSVTEMIQRQHAGTLFVTYRDDQLDSLRNIIACLLDVASRAVLSLTPNPARRVWLIIDEFASVGRVQSVEAVATKARKAGGCLVLGIQSISQLRDRYGDNGAQTILSCLSTWLVLRCSDADTAEYMSRYIGEAEVLRTQQGSSSNDTGDTRTSSEQRLTKRVVLASEVQQFPNLNGLLKIPGGYPVCKVALTIPKHAPTAGAPAFKARDFVARPLLDLLQSTSAPSPESLSKAEALADPVLPDPRVSEPPAERPRTTTVPPQRPRPKIPRTVTLTPAATAATPLPRGLPPVLKRLTELPAPPAALVSNPVVGAAAAHSEKGAASSSLGKAAPAGRRGRRGGPSKFDLDGLLK